MYRQIFLQSRVDEINFLKLSHIKHNIKIQDNNAQLIGHGVLT